MHCESVAVVHVSATTQKSTSVHASQVVADPGCGCAQCPGVHALHCELVALLHVTGCVQSVTGVHRGQDEAGPAFDR